MPWTEEIIAPPVPEIMAQLADSGGTAAADSAVLPAVISLLLPALRQQAEPAAQGCVAAAVLVPILMPANQNGKSSSSPGAEVILTERASGLRRHAGQMSFPGGRIEPGETALQAALRETEEEISLPAAQVIPLGYLGGVTTSLGFHITPIVGISSYPGQFHPDSQEVARILPVPLSQLLDTKGYYQRRWDDRGKHRRSWVVAHDDADIWGATAGIIVALGAAVARGRPDFPQDRLEQVS